MNERSDSAITLPFDLHVTQMQNHLEIGRKIASCDRTIKNRDRREKHTSCANYFVISLQFHPFKCSLVFCLCATTVKILVFSWHQLSWFQQNSLVTRILNLRFQTLQTTINEIIVLRWIFFYRGLRLPRNHRKLDD